MYQTGAAAWISDRSLIDTLEAMRPLLRSVILVLCVSVLKVMLSSNSVTASIIVPLIIASAQSLDLNILSMALPTALSSSLSFTAGYFSIGDMVKPGIVLTIVSSLILGAVVVLLQGFTV